MNTIDKLSAQSVDTNELEQVEAVLSSLPEDSALGRVLGCLTASVRDGSDVLVGSLNGFLTPTQVALSLGVSRAHVYKLLDSGALPFDVVGKKDRRIPVQAFMGFMQTRQGDRRELAERFAHRDSARSSAVARLAERMKHDRES